MTTITREEFDQILSEAPVGTVSTKTSYTDIGELVSHYIYDNPSKTNLLCALFFEQVRGEPDQYWIEENV